MNSNKLNVDVIVRHNFGDIRVTLEEWINTGPGSRLRTAPVKVIDRDTNEELSPETIPLQYRNDQESIQAIVAGKITDPWNRDLVDLQNLLDEKGK